MSESQTQRCISCFAESPVGARFCGQCGRPLGGEVTSPRPTGGERRQLTVLFADLVGSTELSSRLDPEDLSACLRSYHDAATEVVTRHDGHVAQYLGDGLLAYFGWPRAHDDSAVRALRAGLGLIRAVEAGNARLRREYGVELRVRVGVHSGPVLVSDVGGGERTERLALGETPNLAARLQGLAAPGRVAISGDTARLVRGWFHLRSLGEQALRGIPRPVEVLEVEGETGAKTRLEARQQLFPLVGRAAERSRIGAAWEAVQAGASRAVLVVGDAGVGKSRLVQELVGGLGPGVPALRVLCVDGREGVPLHPLAEHLRGQLGIGEGAVGPEAFERLAAAVPAWAGAPASALPLAAALLGFPSGVRYELPTGTPAELRAATFATLTAALVPGPEPRVLILEDVHWSDASTLEWVRTLLSDPAAPPRLVLLTSRPTPDPAGWAALPGAERIELAGLDDTASAEVVSRAAGGRALPPALLDELVRRGGGVPFFLEEMTAALLESRRVEVGPDRVTLLDADAAAVVPPTIQDTLVARLDTLGPARGVAQLASAFGQEFHADLLGETCGLPGPELEGALQRLVGTGFLDPRGADTYTFRHALLRDAAYGTLPRAARQAQHGRIVDALRARSPELAQAQPALLAGHLHGAGRLGEALDHWQLAGQKAAMASAFLESATLYRRALAELGGLPEASERDGRELGLRLGLGLALVSTQGFATPEVEATYRRAAELSTRAEALPFPLLYGIFSVSAVRGDLAALAPVWDRTVALAAGAPDPIQEFWAHSALSMVHVFASRFEDARREGEAAVALLRAHGAETFLPGLIAYSSEALLYGHYYAAWALTELGHGERAAELRREAMALAEGTQHPYMKAVAQGFEAALLLNSGEAEPARDMAAQVIAASAAGGYPWWLYVGKAVHGGALGRLGETAAAAAELQEAIYVIRLMGGFVVVPNYLAYLADTLASAGDRAGALAAAEEGLAADAASLAGAPTSPRLRTLVALERLRAGGPEDAVREALDGARSAGAALALLAGARDYARWLREGGRGAEAESVLDAALAATPGAASMALWRQVQAERVG